MSLFVVVVVVVMLGSRLGTKLEAVIKTMCRNVPSSSLAFVQHNMLQVRTWELV